MLKIGFLKRLDCDAYKNISCLIAVTYGWSAAPIRLIIWDVVITMIFRPIREKRAISDRPSQHTDPPFALGQRQPTHLLLVNATA